MSSFMLGSVSSCQTRVQQHRGKQEHRKMILKCSIYQDNAI
jgi:hypothetical protein